MAAKMVVVVAASSDSGDRRRPTTVKTGGVQRRHRLAASGGGNVRHLAAASSGGIGRWLGAAVTGAGTAPGWCRRNFIDGGLRHDRPIIVQQNSSVFCSRVRGSNRVDRELPEIWVERHHPKPKTQTHPTTPLPEMVFATPLQILEEGRYREGMGRTTTNELNE
ncbi:unnamed protein product [Cuscuta europaea]|uniref:Uncharacterized protein n=1 Tax=Cuscuta europaea TaxID=41803 RepID=A0A9P0ZYW2_CUSEU|nr:unnamed protein product [Cuscuta europaea]